MPKSEISLHDLIIKKYNLVLFVLRANILSNKYEMTHSKQRDVIKCLQDVCFMLYILFLFYLLLMFNVYDVIVCSILRIGAI